MALKFFHAFLVLILAHNSLAMGLKCKVREREALLSLKHGFVDRHGKLSSWGSGENQQECCKWEGIVCSNTTGHVVKLDLGVNGAPDAETQKPLEGVISSSLVELSYLNHLNLGGNFFQVNIPKFIGSLTYLKYLDLREAFRGGRVPSEFGNLSHLQYVDLEWNDLDGDFPAQLTNLSGLKYLGLAANYFTGTVPNQLGNLSHLQYLSIGGNGYGEGSNLTSNNLKWLSSLSSSLTTLTLHFDLSIADNWWRLVSNLHHLNELDLSDTNLPDIDPLSIFNMNVSRSLTYIRLYGNDNLTSSIFSWLLNYKSSLQVLLIWAKLFLGEIPVSLWDMCSLRELYLGGNMFSGQFRLPTYPRCAQKSLEILDLRGNEITGTMPDLSQFSSLRELDLSGNMINGTLSKSIGKLSKLEWLDVRENSLQGLVTQDHFSSLFKLKGLYLSDNALVLNLSRDWLPPFQLETIHLSSCKVGPHFPTWLRTQKNYGELYMSNAGISDTVPRWFWNLPPRLNFLNLSSNQLRGQIPNSPAVFYTQPEICLSSNSFHGPIPSFFSQANSLFLSYNNFTNSSSLLCSDKAKNLTFLQLSNNQLTELPDCWENSKSLSFLDLSHNHLSGQIPTSMGLLTNLQALHLHNNNLYGEIPASLKNCKELNFFDVGHNKLSGPIPLWIGSKLEKLLVFILRSNQFNGSLPQSLCSLSSIQVLDLSQNDIKGSIPKCVKNLTAMSDLTDQSATISYNFNFSFFYSNTVERGGVVDGIFEDSAWVTWKGKESEYSNTLGFLRSIDLSSNNLVGEIPSEIMDLVGLVSLNISRNKLSGKIPSNIGQLQSLDSLDLSRNSLGGSIPIGISQLDRLSLLDVSYNNLSGMIPVSNHVETYNASSFVGNPGLCGAPLPNTCPNEETHDGQSHESDTDDNGIVDRGFHVSMAVGFLLGFLVVCYSLLLTRSLDTCLLQVFYTLRHRV